MYLLAAKVRGLCQLNIDSRQSRAVDFAMRNVVRRIGPIDYAPYNTVIRPDCFNLFIIVF